MSEEILILALHRVGRPPEGASIRGLFTSRRLLAFQVKMLKFLGFEFRTLRDAAMTGGGRTAVLTFDDGYADNYHEGLPILNEAGVPATVFVITGDVGKQDVVWSEAGDKTPSDILSWQQLQEMMDSGWEVGGHADEHVHLERLSATQQGSSIRECVRTIEQNLDFAPVSFAYPYGSYTEDTKRILRDAGIRFAATTIKPGIGELAPSEDQLELKRLAVGGWAWHHYFRVVIRTLGVVGLGGIIGGILRARPVPAPIPQIVED